MSTDLSENVGIHRPAQTHPRGVPSCLRDHDLWRWSWEDLGLSIPTWWWWFPEMTRFLFFGVVIGVICRTQGSARRHVHRRRPGHLGVALIASPRHHGHHTNGHITDTVLNWAEQRTWDWRVASSSSCS
jgi:hypothetical protein